MPSLSAAAPDGHGPPSAEGAVEGRGDALYRLQIPEGAPAPPAYANRTFRQSVRREAGAWLVTVVSFPSPVSDPRPFQPDWSSPALAGLPGPFLGELRAALRSCKTRDAALHAATLFLRARTTYLRQPDFDESPAEVCRRGRASCVGMARLARALLDALGIPCRPVLGLQAAGGSGPAVLEGGALHAWLEADLSGGSVFVDPWYSSGWVPERYVVLRVGDPLAPADLSRLAGGTLSALWRRDRIFYDPPPDTEALLWGPGTPRLFGSGSTLLGKALGSRRRRNDGLALNQRFPKVWAGR